MTDLLKSETDEQRKISDNSSSSSEAEVDPVFEPVITLPEIFIPTNEEDEEVFLKLRAKLYRFDTSGEDGPEWKERGTGEVKILRHNKEGTYRIVMRRDKTLKVCANHYISPDIVLKPSAGSDKAFVYTPIDFADEVPKAECLAIRFGSAENAKLFKEKFDVARDFMEALFSSDESDGESVEENKDEEKTEKLANKLENLSVSQTVTENKEDVDKNDKEKQE